jgi:prepilin-type N-terminal cleavage/methylation domain-containing protein
MKAPLTEKESQKAAGFSVLELLIVVAMISVLTGYALLQIARGHQVMIRENAARQLAAYLEKARLDSVRRCPTASGQMAQVSIINANFYSITTDSDGDGNLDAPQVVSLPVDASLQFDLPYPRTIFFNWRGRTVDSAGNIASPPFVNIRSPKYGATAIELTSSGQATLDGPPPSSAVTNSSPVPTPSFRGKTQVP